MGRPRKQPAHHADQFELALRPPLGSRVAWNIGQAGFSRGTVVPFDRYEAQFDNGTKVTESDRHECIAVEVTWTASPGGIDRGLAVRLIYFNGITWE